MNEENEITIATIDGIQNDRFDGVVSLRSVSALTDIIIFNHEKISLIAMKELRHCLIDLEIPEYDIMRYIETMTEAKKK